MPNNVINEIHLRGVASEIRRLLNNCCERRVDDGIWRIDFRKIIPMPEGMEAVDNACRYWCVPNWGTKWNAYEHERPKFNPGNGYLRFHTAWAAPHPVIREMSRKYPYVEINHYWADEDIGYNCGYRKYRGGKIFVDWKVADDRTKDSFEFASLLWNGCYKNELINSEEDSVLKKLNECVCCECGNRPATYVGIKKRTGVINMYCEECVHYLDSGTNALNGLEIIFIGNREE